MSPKLKQMLVTAIRNDRIVGRGTCSTIDETYTDDELIDALEGSGVDSCHGAVAFMRELEEIFRSREADIRGEIF